jgi:hypothetical protein
VPVPRHAHHHRGHHRGTDQCVHERSSTRDTSGDQDSDAIVGFMLATSQPEPSEAVKAAPDFTCAR